MDKQQIILNYLIKDLMLENTKSQIKKDEDLITAGLLDSLSIMRLVLFLEKQFGIQVRDTEVVHQNFKSIETIGTYVNSKL